MMARAQKAWLAAAMAAAMGGTAAMGAGCGGSDAESGIGEAKLPEGEHVEAIEHEACDEAGHRVEILDANGDKKADVKRVYDNKTGKEICRITDLNHDGKPDMYEYYDANGVLRRREADYDDSGVIDSVEYFENGKLAKRELDTTGQHRIDTWDYFDPVTGKRTKRERDSTNDGKVDQWWTWNGDQVSIAIDKAGTGKPDPADTITIGAPAAPQAPDAGDQTAAADAGAAAATAAADAGPALTAPTGTLSIGALDAGAAPSSLAGDAGASKSTGKGGKKGGGKK
jgi:hypothetical protein